MTRSAARTRGSRTGAVTPSSATTSPSPPRSPPRCCGRSPMTRPAPRSTPHTGQPWPPRWSSSSSASSALAAWSPRPSTTGTPGLATRTCTPTSSSPTRCSGPMVSGAASTAGPSMPPSLPSPSSTTPSWPTSLRGAGRANSPWTEPPGLSQGGTRSAGDGPDAQHARLPPDVGEPGSQVPDPALRGGEPPEGPPSRPQRPARPAHVVDGQLLRPAPPSRSQVAVQRGVESGAGEPLRRVGADEGDGDAHRSGARPCGGVEEPGDGGAETRPLVGEVGESGVAGDDEEVDDALPTRDVRRQREVGATLVEPRRERVRPRAVS